MIIFLSTIRDNNPWHLNGIIYRHSFFYANIRPQWNITFKFLECSPDAHPYVLTLIDDNHEAIRQGTSTYVTHIWAC